MARTIAFSYDGVEHENDLRHCDYTPLKGVIAWQENLGDWRMLAWLYDAAIAAVAPTGGEEARARG